MKIPLYKLVLAATALFCASFAVWEVLAYTRVQRLSVLFVAVLFAVAATMLSAYLFLSDRRVSATSEVQES